MTKKQKRDGKVVHLSTEYHEKLRRYAESVDIPMASIIYAMIDERIAAHNRSEDALRGPAPKPVVAVPVEKKAKPVGIDAIAQSPADPTKPPFWKDEKKAPVTTA